MHNTNLNQCYQDAIGKASALEQECAALSDQFGKESPLQKKVKFSGVLKDIISLVLGLVLLAVGVVAFFGDTPLKISDYSFSGKYIAILLVGIGAVLLFSGVFSLYKMLMLARAKHQVKTLKTLGMTVAGEAKKLENFEQQVQKAIANGEDLIVESAGFWQTQFMNLQAAIVNKTRNDDKKNKLIHTIAAGAIFLFAAIAFYPFIIGGYALKYGNTSGMLVATSYIILAVIITESLFRLDRWYHTKAKWIVGGIFGAYQLAVILGLIINKTFANLSAAISGGKSEAILKNIVFNYPILSLLLISLVMVFVIARANYDLIAVKVEEESCTLDMSDSTTQVVQLRWQKTKIRYKCMIKIPFVIAMGACMGYIVERGFSFISVLLYLAIAAVYFGITFTMDIDEGFQYVYGRLSKYLRLLLFVGYVTIALSLIPGFGIGSLILIGLHALASFGGAAVTVKEK